jgi:predicted nucleic acid-binding protein
LNAIAAFEVVVTDPALVLDAHLPAEREQLAWFDALIVEAAIRNACTILCSEDLQHARQYSGLTVLNPFLIHG